MRRGRHGSPTIGRSPSRNNRKDHDGKNARTTTTTTTTTTTLKRRPCQDIRGPQRLISYQIPNANPDKELNVIRAIIARETALADLLAHVSKYKPTLVPVVAGGSTLNSVTACFGALDQQTTELLLGMRITSVGVTEAIQDWRSQLTLPRPFVWQKKNYLQGMGCDVDFLHFDKCVAGVLGNGRTKRNPFVTEGRNVDELSQFMWGAGDTPNSVIVSRIDGMRLRQAARMLVEEEMRCGKADHRKPPPTWYIQRKKRMLAMGINLQAGAAAPSITATKSISKPPPKKRKKQHGEQSLKIIQEADDDRSKNSPGTNSNKKKRKKKQLLEVTDAELLENEVEIKVCSGRKRMWGWSRDGRMFLSSAEAWLLPRRSSDDEEEEDNEDERMEIRAEITMGLPSKDGSCGTQICSSLVVSVATLKRGGFYPISMVIDAPLAVAPTDDVKNNRKGRKGKRSGKKINRGKKKRVERAAKGILSAKKIKHTARITIGDAAISYLLDRIVPTIHGISWEQDGDQLRRLNKRLLAPLVGNYYRSKKRKEPLRTKFRTGIRLSTFWCAVSAWIPKYETGGGLVLDILTVSSSHSKRLRLDRQALERLLGSELFSTFESRTTKRPNSRSSSRPGSRSSSRPTSRGAGSRPNSRPSSRGASSRPSSHGANRKTRSSSVESTAKMVNYDLLPPLNVLARTVLEQCIVVVDTPSGPEFFAQPSIQLSNTEINPTNKNNSDMPVVGNPFTAPEIIAAAATPAMQMPATPHIERTAGALFLSGGMELIDQQEDSCIEDAKDQINDVKEKTKTNIVKDTMLLPVLQPITPEISKTKTTPTHLKVLAKGALVGGLYFLVDMYWKESIFYVTATYPASGVSISMIVSTEQAVKCSSLLKKIEEGGEVDQQETNISVINLQKNANAILSELDLDHEVPPGLMLRFEDEATANLHRPLYALGTLTLVSPVKGGASTKNRSIRPLTPLLPIFSPLAIVADPKRPLSPESHLDRQSIAKRALCKLVTSARREMMKDELSKEAEEKVEGHRKTLSAVEIMKSNQGKSKVMRISLIER